MIITLLLSSTVLLGLLYSLAYYFVGMNQVIKWLEYLKVYKKVTLDEFIPADQQHQFMNHISEGLIYLFIASIVIVFIEVLLVSVLSKKARPLLKTFFATLIASYFLSLSFLTPNQMICLAQLTWTKSPALDGTVIKKNHSYSSRGRYNEYVQVQIGEDKTEHWLNEVSIQYFIQTSVGTPVKLHWCGIANTSHILENDRFEWVLMQLSVVKYLFALLIFYYYFAFVIYFWRKEKKTNPTESSL